MTSLEEQLRRRGWFLHKDAIEEFVNEEEKCSADDIIRKVLDLDLCDIGSGCMPEEWSRNCRAVEKVSGPAVWQIQRIRNVSAPKSDPDSDHGNEFLRLYLTDGVTSFSAVLAGKCAGLCVQQTPPGTKLLLNPQSVSVCNGFVLLSERDFKVLGGTVQHMVEKWKLAKNLSQHKRASGEAGPPPWVPFGQQIDKELLRQLKTGGPFKAMDRAGVTKSAPNEAFERHRMSTIEEVTAAAGSNGRRKVFGGGAREMHDADVAAICARGYTAEAAGQALRNNNYNVTAALQSLSLRGDRADRDRGSGRGNDGIGSAGGNYSTGGAGRDESAMAEGRGFRASGGRRGARGGREDRDTRGADSYSGASGGDGPGMGGRVQPSAPTTLFDMISTQVNLPEQKQRQPPKSSVRRDEPSRNSSAITNSASYAQHNSSRTNNGGCGNSSTNLNSYPGYNDRTGNDVGRDGEDAWHGSNRRPHQNGSDHKHTTFSYSDTGFDEDSAGGGGRNRAAAGGAEGRGQNSGHRSNRGSEGAAGRGGGGRADRRRGEPANSTNFEASSPQPSHQQQQSQQQQQRTERRHARRGDGSYRDGGYDGPGSGQVYENEQHHNHHYQSRGNEEAIVSSSYDNDRNSTLARRGAQQDSARGLGNGGGSGVAQRGEHQPRVDGYGADFPTLQSSPSATNRGGHSSAPAAHQQRSGGPYNSNCQTAGGGLAGYDYSSAQSYPTNGFSGSDDPAVESDQQHLAHAVYDGGTSNGLRPGQRVLARYWEDDLMYRAIVHEMAASGRTCVVNFIDYGNYEEVMVQDIEPDGWDDDSAGGGVGSGASGVPHQKSGRRGGQGGSRMYGRPDHHQPHQDLRRNQGGASKSGEGQNSNGAMPQSHRGGGPRRTGGRGAGRGSHYGNRRQHQQQH